MVKKMKSTTTGGAAAKQQSSHLAASVKESAQQIWLAGMGAFSKAQAEGGKVFETLVKEGISLQKKTQGLAEDKISEKALGELGVPTAKDVDALVKRVDALAAAVAKLSKTAPAKAPRATAKTVAKPAAKAPARRARKTAASA